MALRREQVVVEGADLSVLTADAPDTTPLLLLHGTFWSRVWQPILPALARARRPLALDLPGFGRSGGELTVERAHIPALAETVLQAADALGLEEFDLGAHDIGGAVAQHLAVHAPSRVRSLVLMNSVMLDSWPVPAVERFRDAQVRAETTVDDLLAARRTALSKAVDRELSDDEIEDYLSPWRDERRARSWMAMAAAADARYTLDLVPSLEAGTVPTRLVWGREDAFQRLEYAERYAASVPDVDLATVPGRHIPTEDAPEHVAEAILDHLARR